MASQIDGTVPEAGSPTTLSVKNNFIRARDELSGYLRTAKDFATTSGTSTAYVVDFGVAAAKVAGERVTAFFHVANSANATININSTGSSPIKVFGGEALAAEMIKAGAYHELMWNAVDSHWELINPFPVQSQYFTSSKTITLTGAVTGSVSTTFGPGSSSSIATSSSNTLGLSAYPVGSLYLSTSSTDPSTIFGGTWVRYGGGKALVGVKTVPDPQYALGVDSYGSETQTLTVDQMPSHSHATTIDVRENRSSSSGAFPEGASSPITGSATFTSNEVGGGQSFDNRMPYVAIAIWKRTS